MKHLKKRLILAIESSCDETAASVAVEDKKGVKMLSNIVSSSLEIQAKYGGVVPEQAAREQLKAIVPVIQEAMSAAQITKNDIDAVAVTEGPGLIGSLLIGVEFAKTLSLIWNKPLVAVHHLVGHFYANWILPEVPNPKFQIPKFPAIGLLVSGGHSDLVLMRGHGEYEYLGGTRDDAAGECFDKAARLMNLPYPGGPMISKLAASGNPKAYHLPRPMIGAKNFDFSFSGLKTAILNLVEADKGILEDEQKKADLAASVEAAIVDVLVKKTVAAAQKYEVGQIVVAGGVAANTTLRQTLQSEINKNLPQAELHIPPIKLCTDNAAYIAAAAIYNYHPVNPLTLQANPNLSLSH